MESEEYGLRDMYRDWKRLSPNRRRVLRRKAVRFGGRAIRFVGRQMKKDLIELPKLALAGAVTLAALSLPALLDNSSNGLESSPKTIWRSRNYERKDGSTVLERRYYPAGGDLSLGRISYIDRDSDGLDLEDDVYMLAWRATKKRKATERDIRVFRSYVRSD